MDKMLNSSKMTIVLVVLVVVFAIHVIARNTENVRADMTANDLYSLSEGTRSILEKMQEGGVKPIEMKLYFSETTGKSLPKFIKQFITYNRYMRTDGDDGASGRRYLYVIKSLANGSGVEGNRLFGEVGSRRQHRLDE